VSEEVFIADASIVEVGDADVEFIKQQALASPRRRSRICAHRSGDDALHEMIIAISRDSYVHPHRHFGKSESFHVVQGSVDVAIFEDDGTLETVVPMGVPGSGRQFFYRLSDRRYHTLCIRTPVVVIHEVTNGPFDPALTELAPFAPPEAERERAQGYMAHVTALVDRFVAEGRQ
jgi:cupin fold WbuC family metalloprotein